jgi:hypothetical protein
MTHGYFVPNAYSSIVRHYFFPFFFFLDALFPVVTAPVVGSATALPSTLPSVGTDAIVDAIVGTARARGDAMEVRSRRLRDSKRLRMMEEYVLYFRHYGR